MRARDRFVEHLRRGPRYRSGAPGVPASFPHGDRARDEPGASRPPVASSAMISRSRHCVGCSKRCGHVEPSPDRVPAVFTDCARDPGPTDTSSLLCEVPAKQLVRGGTFRGGDSSPVRLQRRSVEKVRARRSLSARLPFQGDLASIVRFECSGQGDLGAGDCRPARARSSRRLDSSARTTRFAGAVAAASLRVERRTEQMRSRSLDQVTTRHACRRASSAEATRTRRGTLRSCTRKGAGPHTATRSSRSLLIDACLHAQKSSGMMSGRYRAKCTSRAIKTTSSSRIR